MELSASEIAADLLDAQRLGLGGRGGALDALTLAAGECFKVTVTFHANPANDLTCPPSYIII